MTCSAVGILLRHSCQTGDKFSLHYTCLTCVCLPTRQQLPHAQPLSLVGFGMKAPCKPAPIVLPHYLKVSHQLPSKAFVHSLELTKSLLVSSSTAAISCPLLKKQLLDISPRIRSHGLSLLFKHSIPQSLHCPLHKLSLFHDLVTTYGL